MHIFTMKPRLDDLHTHIHIKILINTPTHTKILYKHRITESYIA